MPPAQTHAGQSIRQRAVVKPVLANPYATAWPALPNHLQNGVMAALPQLVPDAVAEYHTDRARCSQAAKRARRKAKRAEGMDVDVDGQDKKAEGGEGKEKEKDDSRVPARPEILDHLVLGLNETIRALEAAISALRLRMMLAEGPGRFLPTAPPAGPSPPSPPEEAPIAFLLVPHTSVSPLALVDPLPTYCATYNTLLRQAGGGTEIRLLPLGGREPQLAEAVGLRRITSVGVRGSHPAVGVLERLVGGLVPLRHSMTLPWPSARLVVHGGEGTGEKEGPGEGKKAGEGREEKKETEKRAKPTHPPIEYAPLHIKAVHTTAPGDANARKAARLAEVRAKRVEKKAQRAAARKTMERKVRSELSGKFVPGRASRRAAKAAKGGKTKASKPGKAAAQAAAKNGQAMDIAA